MGSISKMIRNIMLPFLVLLICNENIRANGGNIGRIEKEININLIICNETEAKKPKRCINIGRIENFGTDAHLRLKKFLETFLVKSFTGSAFYATLFWIWFGILIGQLTRDTFAML